MMTTYHFQSYPAVAEATFTCPACGKPKRKRTFRAECTVNPFNRRPDGEIRTPQEVRQQSREWATQDRDQFMNAPLCAACENGLSYTQRKVVLAQRQPPAVS